MDITNPKDKDIEKLKKILNSPVTYTNQQFQEAYRAWVRAGLGIINYTQHELMARWDAWDNYVDHRDGLPLGTSKEIRTRRDRVLI